MMTAHQTTDEVENHTEVSERDKFDLERLIFFSDAVFAIAIKLLALEIRLPEREEALDNAQLLTSLLGL
jgi:uncharacterized membrane protein